MPSHIDPPITFPNSAPPMPTNGSRWHPGGHPEVAGVGVTGPFADSGFDWPTFGPSQGRPPSRTCSRLLWLSASTYTILQNMVLDRHALPLISTSLPLMNGHRPFQCLNPTLLKIAGSISFQILLSRRLACLRLCPVVILSASCRLRALELMHRLGSPVEEEGRPRMGLSQVFELEGEDEAPRLHQAFHLLCRTDVAVGEPRRDPEQLREDVEAVCKAKLLRCIHALAQSLCLVCSCPCNLPVCEIELPRV
jgi:hypothetical protein